MAEPIGEFFSRLGFPLRNRRWSWGADGIDGALMLRTWQGEVSDKGRKVQVLGPTSNPLDLGSSQGRAERVEQLRRIWAGGIAAYTVVARAEDMRAIPRQIAGFRRDAVFPIDHLVLEIDGSISAVLAAPVLVERLAEDAGKRRLPKSGGDFPAIAPDKLSANTGTASRTSSADYIGQLPAMRARLIVVARRKGRVRYGDLMKEFSIGRFVLRHAMSKLGHGCQLADEPILTSLIVNKLTGRCSAGLKAEFGVADDEAERVKCYAYWPMAPAVEAFDVLAATQALEERARQFAEVEFRPDQAEFRRKVFIACNGRCVLSGCDVSAVLDAAHFKDRDWRKGHNNASDGVLLRADLHRLYDAGLLTISNAGDVDIDKKAEALYGSYRGSAVSARANH